MRVVVINRFFVLRVEQRLHNSAVVCIRRVTRAVIPRSVRRAVGGMSARHVHVTTARHHRSNGKVDVLSSPQLHACVQAAQLVEEALLNRPMSNRDRTSVGKRK